LFVKMIKVTIWFICSFSLLNWIELVPISTSNQKKTFRHSPLSR
jgi:hypothetical protein